MSVQFRFTKGGYANLPVFQAQTMGQATLTSGATAVHTTVTAPDGNLLCRVINGGPTTVYAAVGVNIVADADNGMMISPGQTEALGCVPNGSRGSVVDV